MTNESNDMAGVSFHSTSTYTLLEEIGRGGMGIIFLAEKDTEGVRDKVVLKTIKTFSKTHEDQLREEANTATGLRHENIVKTYGLESLPLSLLPASFRKDIDSPPPARLERSYHPHSATRRLLRKKSRLLSTARPVSHHKTQQKPDEKKLFFIAMDYVIGPDLYSLHRDHMQWNLLIPPELVAFIISRICRALAYAHEYIVHRDISPENILINTHGVCKLTDFGVAAHTPEELKALTGKFGYMSPEQVYKEPVDARTDTFSLGLVAYELLTGVHLYSVPLNASLEYKRHDIIKKMAEPIVPPHEVRTDVSEILSRIIMNMLDKDKDKRYKNMQDAGDVLEQKYLYARGFGPTNNSLASYIDIFYKDFKEYDQEQLRQLNFLKGPEGKIALRRKIRPRFYTATGLKLAQARPHSQLAKSLSARPIPGE